MHFSLSEGLLRSWHSQGDELQGRARCSVHTFSISLQLNMVKHMCLYMYVSMSVYTHTYTAYISTWKSLFELSTC